MNEMIERVVKAMKYQAEDVPVGVIHPKVWEAMARAAIAAMREPTEAMLNAEHDSPAFGKKRLSEEYAMEYSDAETVWKAMIDAALEEKL